MRRILKEMAAQRSGTSRDPFRIEFKNARSALLRREARVGIFKTCLMLEVRGKYSF